MKIHLIDGTFELFRAFYGAPRAVAPGGIEVGATRSLLRNLANFLKRPDVTHVACAFDHVIESFRNELFAGYKTGDGIDPDLWSQFALAERAAEALGMVVWPMVEFEADDALATAAARFADEPEVEQILLCSPDKDLAQCVRGKRVVMWDRLRDRVIDADGVVKKFGVEPASIPHYLALVGDAADGIPGVPRWGAKSAATLLSHYGSVEEIPYDCHAWGVSIRGAQRLAENLAASRDAIALYTTLATLRTDVPLPQRALADLQWRGPQSEHLRALESDLGLRSKVL